MNGINAVGPEMDKSVDRIAPRRPLPPAQRFAAFDLLWLDGRDVRVLPLVERKRRLQNEEPKDFCESTKNGEIRRLFVRAAESGIMWKSPLLHSYG